MNRAVKAPLRRMSSIRVGDVELHVEEGGDGPALLLIAGIPAIASDWAPLRERVAAWRHVIAYDNRGSGRSTVTPGPYTTRRLAADAAGLLEALGIAHADVFGMSMGGMIAQELALGWPERVRRLVLGCTHAGGRHAARQPREAGRAFALRTDDWGERMRVLAPFAFARGVDAGTLARFIEKKMRDVQDPVGYQAQIDAVLAHDSYARLPTLRTPTLIITGDDDQVIPAASSDVLHQQIPGSRLELIHGAGHLFFLEQPGRTVALLKDFLGGT
jgi:3-oxoadipate enol-lactonase